MTMVRTPSRLRDGTVTANPSQGLLTAPAGDPTAAIALTAACFPTAADGELHEVGVVPEEELRRMARNTATTAITTTATAAITISRRDRAAEARAGPRRSPAGRVRAPARADNAGLASR